MQEYEQNMYVCMNPSSLIFKKRTTIEEMRGGLCEKRKPKYPKNTSVKRQAMPLQMLLSSTRLVAIVALLLQHIKINRK